MWWKFRTNSREIESVGKLWSTSVNAMLGTQVDPVEQQPRELPLFYEINVGPDFVCLDCSEGDHCEFGVAILTLENEKVRCGCKCVVEVVARQPSKHNVPRGTWKPTSTARQDPFWKR